MLPPIVAAEHFFADNCKFYTICYSFIFKEFIGVHRFIRAAISLKMLMCPQYQTERSFLNEN